MPADSMLPQLVSDNGGEQRHDNAIDLEGKKLDLESISSLAWDLVVPSSLLSSRKEASISHRRW